MRFRLLSGYIKAEEDEIRQNKQSMPIDKDFMLQNFRNADPAIKHYKLTRATHLEQNRDARKGAEKKKL